MSRHSAISHSRVDHAYDNVSVSRSCLNRETRQLLDRVEAEFGPVQIVSTFGVPQAEYAAIHKAVLDQCDALDGVKDGVLENPRRCKFDPAVDAPGAGLTASQASSVKALMTDLKLKDGATLSLHRLLCKLADRLRAAP